MKPESHDDRAQRHALLGHLRRHHAQGDVGRDRCARGAPLVCAVRGVAADGCVTVEAPYSAWADSLHPHAARRFCRELNTIVTVRDAWPGVSHQVRSTTFDRAAPVTLALQIQGATDIRLDGRIVELVLSRVDYLGSHYGLRPGLGDPWVAPGKLEGVLLGKSVEINVVEPAKLVDAVPRVPRRFTGIDSETRWRLVLELGHAAFTDASLAEAKAIEAEQAALAVAEAGDSRAAQLRRDFAVEGCPVVDRFRDGLTLVDNL